MTQPIDIITNALTNIGAQAIGEPVDAGLATFAFNKLNNILDRWSNENFMVYAINEIAYTIAGSTTWTIGPTGQIVTTRPLSINSAFVRVTTSNGPLDFPVAVINVEQYELIGLKQLPGPWPRSVYYQPTMPNGVLNFWPLPAQGEIHLFCQTLFSAFVTLYDTINFPPGYVQAMEWTLSEQMLPAFGRTAQDLVAMIKANAIEARGAVKRTNMKPLQVVEFDQILTSMGRVKDAGWILSGGFK
jgi:hypothetical protein